jgi:hypothetical protein
VFKRFQQVLFGLFEFDPEMTLSVIDPINLRYRDVIAAKKGSCEPVPNNLVTANKISQARVMARPIFVSLILQPWMIQTPQKKNRLFKCSTAKDRSSWLSKISKYVLI